ncbi:heat-shock protein [Vibrio mediterranei]
MAKQLINLPDREVQQWKPFTLDSTIYEFSHLDARKHTFIHPTRNEQYTLFFTFSHHVFTRSPEKQDATDDSQYYPFPSDRRIFDKTRYNLSRHLPQIVETLPEQFCYHGGYSRYCSCKVRDDDNKEINYQVVYRVWKKSGKMRFHIESAYPLNGTLGRKKKVNFWVICHNLLRGKPMPKPAN